MDRINGSPEITENTTQLPTKSCLVHRNSAEDYDNNSDAIGCCSSSSLVNTTNEIFTRTESMHVVISDQVMVSRPCVLNESLLLCQNNEETENFNNPIISSPIPGGGGGGGTNSIISPETASVMLHSAMKQTSNIGSGGGGGVVVGNSIINNSGGGRGGGGIHCDTISSGFVSGSSSSTTYNNNINFINQSIIDQESTSSLSQQQHNNVHAPTILRPRTSVCATTTNGKNRLSHSRSPPLRRASAGCLYSNRLKECGANEFIPIESGHRVVVGSSGSGGGGGVVNVGGSNSVAAGVAGEEIPCCSNSYDRCTVGWEDDSTGNSSCSPSHSLASFSLDCDGTDASLRGESTTTTQRSRSASFQTTTTPQHRNGRSNGHHPNGLLHSNGHRRRHHHRHHGRGSGGVGGVKNDNLLPDDEDLPDENDLNPTTMNDSIALVVDNRRFVININCLRSKPHTMLGRMFSGSLPPTRYRLQSGDYSLSDSFFPGLTADVFASLLEYYTKGRMHCPPSITVQEYKDICDYFLVPFNHRTVQCANLRAFLHEVSNDGAKEIFERFLDDDLLPEMVKSAKLGERECHIVILLDDDIVDWDHDNPPQIPDNEINSQILYSTQMYRFLKYIENREVAKQVLIERGLKKIRIGIEGYPTQKEKVKMRSGHRKEVIYNFAQRPFLRMSWEEEENRSRHVDFQFVKSKSNNDLTSLSLGEAAENRAVDLPPSLTPPPVLGVPADQQNALLESLHPLRNRSSDPNIGEYHHHFGFNHHQYHQQQQQQITSPGGADNNNILFPIHQSSHWLTGGGGGGNGESENGGNIGGGGSGSSSSGGGGAGNGGGGVIGTFYHGNGRPNSPPTPPPYDEVEDGGGGSTNGAAMGGGDNL